MILFYYYFWCYVIVTVLCYRDEFSDGYHYHRAFPQDVMVDVINNFGLALLEAHNEGNENNIALSPYGATSVLVALGEGVRGYAVKEIQEAAHIPLDISVIRVGLRDIHRHLKSYFIPKEGFLAGLTLSNKKVPLIPRYEEILRFYGYDLDSFNNPLYPDAFGTTPAIYMNLTTMTTPYMSETTIQDSTLTTTEMPTVSIESRTETTESETNTTPTNLGEMINTTSFIANTTIQSSTNEISTTKNIGEIDEGTVKSSPPVPLTTTLEEFSTITTQAPTVRTVAYTTDAGVTKNPTTTQPSTSTANNELTNPLSKNNSDNSISNSNIEEVIFPTSLKPETLVITNTEVTKLPFVTTEVAMTKTSIINYQSTTPDTKNNSNKITTSNSIENVTFPSTSIEPLTSINTEGTKASFLPTETTIPKDVELLTTTPNMYDLLSTIRNSELVDNPSTTFEDTTIRNRDPANLSDMINGDIDINAILQDQTTTLSATTEFVMKTRATTQQNPTTMTTANTGFVDLTANPDDFTELISENTSHAELTTTDDISSEEVIVTTSVTHSISKVETTYETSSSISTTLIDNEETSTANQVTSVVTENTENKEFSLNDSSFPEETTAAGITDDNSTNVVTTETTKRGIRSVIDYVIARHYDNFPERFGYERKYKPEDKLSFLVYGKVRETNINFMTYDAVLPVAYIPIIDALALSFPLDSKEYYLLLLLPIEENGINKLIHNLKRKISLRNVISSLRYSHVRAIIPSFMLKGYVILTSTLQKLGIRRIFEPRHTDFSSMTKERDIYVTNIEQAVTVTIRNYVDPENLPNYKNLQRFRPTEFKADHPFLYFVMDTDIHVNLMAGKIVNPLNSRIR